MHYVVTKYKVISVSAISHDLLCRKIEDALNNLSAKEEIISISTTHVNNNVYCATITVKYFIAKEFERRER